MHEPMPAAGQLAVLHPGEAWHRSARAVRRRTHRDGGLSVVRPHLGDLDSFFLTRTQKRPDDTDSDDKRALALDTFGEAGEDVGRHEIVFRSCLRFYELHNPLHNFGWIQLIGGGNSAHHFKEFG